MKDIELQRFIKDPNNEKNYAVFGNNKALRVTAEGEREFVDQVYLPRLRASGITHEVFPNNGYYITSENSEAIKEIATGLSKNGFQNQSLPDNS